jgi:hypothetical protein
LRLPSGGCRNEDIRDGSGVCCSDHATLSGNPILSGSEYIESLRGRNLKVYLMGELVAEPVDNDLAEARRLNDRIHPLASVFYADPFVDMHNRMKGPLVILGRLPRAVVRPPLVKIKDVGIARIRAALVAASLLDGSGKRLEAA